MKSTRNIKTKGDGVTDTDNPRFAYLHTVHLVFAYYFDSDVALLACCVAGTVYIAEGTIAHLVDEFPAFETGVAREFALAGILLGDKLGELLIVNALLALAVCVIVIAIFVSGFLCPRVVRVTGV
jgi:hypothetical protein